MRVPAMEVDYVFEAYVAAVAVVAVAAAAVAVAAVAEAVAVIVAAVGLAMAAAAAAAAAEQRPYFDLNFSARAAAVAAAAVQAVLALPTNAQLMLNTCGDRNFRHAGSINCIRQIEARPDTVTSSDKFGHLLAIARFC